MLLGYYLLFFGLLTFTNGESLPNSCASPVYCHGALLHTVQLARIFNDSKTFVDLKMKDSEAQTLQNFESFINSHPNPTKAEVRQFVNENFEEGKELSEWTLPDFNETPKFITEIRNATVLNFTQELISKWPELARHVKEEVSLHPERYSLIPVPNGFIVPGGRFREYYYWDSYWIVDGLLINEMTVTARGMIDNFITLVERYGFVPNGGRVYYLARSQPPLLTPMAHLYYQHTKNITWLEQNIASLAKELDYWINQTVTIQRGFRTYTMAHYNAPSNGPRPESYREDIQTAKITNNPTEKQEIYTDLKSGAESGWDFSTRWIFDESHGNQQNLSYIETRRVVPVDLNAFLCGAFRDISELYGAVGDADQEAFWNDNYKEMRRAINDILWDETDGVWYDFDVKQEQHRKFFYPSGLTPLWSRCFEENKGPALGERLLEYLLKEEVLKYLGGIPTSKEFTGEQWDYPNAWPPLQDIVVRGLYNSGHDKAQEEAKILASHWVNANIIGYNKTGVMFEKYDATIPGSYGQGGEYDVQSGFGWSNGVALRFIYDYYRSANGSHSIRANSAYSISASGVLFWCACLILKVLN